jgi:hydrophobic/amphiphilic exporter-1 (mainly G- bacteria), HAE1 family
MLFLAVLLLGAISFQRLPVDLLPEVSYPRLVVLTTYPGVAPAEVEQLITRGVEARAASVPGVQRVTSVSREGVSLVTVRFTWGTDMDFALLNLRERLDELRNDLPRTASRPRILRVDPDAEPVLVLSVAGQASLASLTELAETVFRRRLEQLDGVAQASVTGGVEREIRVELDPDRLRALGLSIPEVERALALANVQAPGGTILQGRFRYPVRTLGEFRSVEEIGEVTVSEGPGGAGRVRVRDLGRVIDGFAERESETRHNGVEAIGILIYKESGANTVQVARAVEEALHLLHAEFPELSVEVASSQAGFISDSIDNVVQALVFGGILAFLILFLFLRDPRYPVAVAVAIPLSVVGTFALMDAFGVSLNIMSLGGLALGVGMLVDNSIVVLENIFRRRSEGEDAVEAAGAGAEEVQGAITASTLTTIAVFGPIIYVQGVAGELFRDLSLTVAFALLVSLLVAVTLLPSLAARFGRTPARADAPGDPAAGVGSPSAPLSAFERGMGALAARYHALLASALDRRGPVLAGTALVFGATLLLGTLLGRDLLPAVDQGAFEVRVTLPEGTPLRTTAALAAELEGALLNDPGVAAVFSRVGRDVQASGAADEASGAHTALLQARVVEGERTEGVLERLRPLAARYPGGAVAFATGGATALGRILGGGESDVAVRVRGEDLELAFAHAEALRERLGSVRGIGNLRLAVERGQPELQVEIDREAAAGYGIAPRLIAESVEKAMRGGVATEFVDFDRRIAIVVRYPEELRTRRETLEGLIVQGVPLRELARIREAMGPSEIRREDQGRVVTVQADVVSGGLDRAIEGIGRALGELPTPGALRVEVGGENEEMRRSFRDLAFAFALALLLVYMILAAQFESFVHPATILVSVPLALAGAVLALFLTGEGLNTMSLIGMVILIGIVVNDAIVKVDFIVQARTRGATVRDAVLEAGRVRFRPILMTTITTACGLLPMALGLGRGADLRAPLAISVIGGLVVATVLTLIVVPVVFSLIEELRTRRTAPASTLRAHPPAPARTTRPTPRPGAE